MKIYIITTLWLCFNVNELQNTIHSRDDLEFNKLKFCHYGCATYKVRNF